VTIVIAVFRASANAPKDSFPTPQQIVPDVVITKTVWLIMYV